MTTTIYTIGYRQPDAEAQLAQLTREGYHLVDIRRRAGSRFRAAYNLLRLACRFGNSYHRIRELGNENYQDKHAPFVLLDQETGIRKALNVIQDDAQGKGIILLCACEDWQRCHRSHVADLLLDRLPGAQIIHLHGDGTSTTVTTLAESTEVQYGDILTYEERLSPPAPQPLIQTRQVRGIAHEEPFAGAYLVAVDPDTIDKPGGNRYLMPVPRECVRRVMRPAAKKEEVCFGS